jgi:hypothetical protein
MTKDWKLIFNIKNYHYILVEETIKENYLNFYWQHYNEIKSIDSFFLMMPEKEDLETSIHDNYVLRFAPRLKPFIDNPDYKTLFIEEDILKSIVKEDKLNNFFRYLKKNNKNIVLFYYNDINKYVQAIDASCITLTEQELTMQYNLFDRFIDIKLAINKTHNPFKDPIAAFNKIQKDENS